MTDDRFEPLDRLAERAPLPAAGLADRVLAQGQRSRLRRTGLTLASAGTVAALVLGGLWAGDVVGTEGTRPATAPPSTAAATSTPTVEPPPTAEPSDRVQVAAAAIERLVSEAATGRVELLLLSDRVCDEWDIALWEGSCPRWGPAELEQLEQRLGRLAQVRVFTGDPPDLDVGTLAVSVAALHVGSDAARVFAFTLVGIEGSLGEGCLGETYHLTRQGVGWEPADGGGMAVIC